MLFIKRKTLFHHIRDYTCIIRTIAMESHIHMLPAGAKLRQYPNCLMRQAKAELASGQLAASAGIA